MTASVDWKMISKEQYADFNRGKRVEIESIFVSPAKEGSGSLFVTLGLMNILKSRYKRVAFYKPILDREADSDPETVISLFALSQKVDECYSMSVEDVEHLLASGDEEILYERLISDFERLKASYDFVLCMGFTDTRLMELAQKDINIAVAMNLSSAIVGVMRADGESDIDEAEIWIHSIQDEGLKPLALIINRVSDESIGITPDEIDGVPIFKIPYNKELDCATVMDILDATDAQLLHGDDSVKLQQSVTGIKIAAMRPENFLNHLENGNVVITPADRSDILITILSAAYSAEFGTVSAMIVGGDMPIADSVIKLYRSSRDFPIVIARSEYDTMSLAQKAFLAEPKLTPAHTRKLDILLGHFRRFVDSERIENYLHKQMSDIVTPTMFLHRIFTKASRLKKRIVLPESNDRRVLEAAERISRRGIADIILLGKREEISNRASAIGIDLSSVEIIDYEDSTLIEQFAKRFYEIRRHKGVTLEEARDKVKSISYFATMMVEEGLADGMVSGATHTTAETVRPALQIFGTTEGVNTVSSLFFMCLETRVLVYGDCAIVVDPDYKQLAEIAVSSAKTAKAFGIEPIVALLSYSSGSSGKGEEVEKVRRASEIAKQMLPDIPIEGPLQYDAAIDPGVAKIKMPNSKVAGRANVFIFPDLNTGNNTYKAVQRSTGAIAIGPVLQGLKRAVNDLSRGCSVDDIVSTVAITAIQAEQLR